MQAFLIFLLTISVSVFATSAEHSQKKAPELGLSLKFSSFDKKQAELEYIIEGEKRETSVKLGDLYGIYAAYPFTSFLELYGNFHYQYIQILANEKQAKNKESMDAHELVLDAGLEFKLLLYQMSYFPLAIHLNISGGVGLGYAFYAESEFKNTAVFTYAHAIGISFLFKNHYFFKTGLDWSHHYSRAYAKNTEKGGKKANTLLLDYDNSGRIYFSLGYKF